jgi:UDP-glucose 4-epimerase
LQTLRTRGTSLRFSNVFGTANLALLDNSHENLVPIVINVIQQGQAPVIFGVDYPTPDGTCIRDYVDVGDMALAHLLAANASSDLLQTIKISTGSWRSLREIIDLVLKSEGSLATVYENDGLLGDSAILIADV